MATTMRRSWGPLALLLLATTAVLAMALLVPTADAWGWDGHEVTMRVALHRLEPAALKRVLQLAGPQYVKNPEKMASWADGKEAYHCCASWAKTLHYLNLPGQPGDKCDVVYNEVCQDDRCVIGAIHNFTRALQDEKKSEEDLQLALYFLTHFVGDIHQPLHASFASDRGGNDFWVHYNNKKTRLHGLWDYAMISKFMDDNFRGSQELLWKDLEQWITTQKDDFASYCPVSQEGDLPMGCPGDWATESSAVVCSFVYTGLTDGQDLPRDYDQKAMQITYQRLAQGGIRLAHLLNQLFG